MLSIAFAGCDRRSDETATLSTGAHPVLEATAASRPTLSPRQYLEAVFARYRRADAYRDRGIVRLEYQEQGRRESKTAPMQIWFDRDRLYLEAYDVRLSSDGDFLTAWFRDAESNDFDSQVLRIPAISGRPTIRMLLADPILAGRISAGMAGPPPQLDWLFAGRPMAELFAAGHRFEFGNALAIDGRLCRGVQVHAGQDLYQFWIDETAGMIRRVELPTVTAPTAPGQPLQSMKLSIELAAPELGSVSTAPDISPLPAQPKYVRRFVALPPASPDPILGSRSPSFRLTDKKRNQVIGNRNAGRDATMLFHFAAGQPFADALAAIDQWNAGMPDELQERIQIAVLVEPQSASQVPGNPKLPVITDDQGVARSLRLPPGGLLILDRQGNVAWSQPQLPPPYPQSLATLGAVLGDILHGVDVPARIRAQWRDQVAEYQRSLSRESVRGK